MKMREASLFSLTLLLGTFVLGGIAFGWTAPSFAPPSGNVAAPLNTGVTSQTKSGNLTVAQLTSSASSGTAPFVVNSQTKVANLNADLLDGLDASGFGDATAANQTTLLSKIGTSTDAANMDTTLFGGLQYLWDNRTSFGGGSTLANQTTMLSNLGTIAGNVDNAYSACWTTNHTQTNMTCTDMPASMGSFTRVGCVSPVGGTTWTTGGVADSMTAVYCLPR